jgi:hypothetical protein
MRFSLFALAAALLSCNGHGGNVLIGAAMGLTAAGVSRSQGGCYAACPVGTTCNKATGYCDELPCRDRCSANEICDTTLAEPACMPIRSPSLLINRETGEKAVPPSN